MKCTHPTVDKGFCYYCGECLSRPGPSSPSDRVVFAFGVEHIDALQLVTECLVKVYANVPEDQRASARDLYRKPMDLLGPILQHLKDIRLKQNT